jgi:NAD(P)-dependent dehydrogenase (short-subunit alcohol dehydrogenase family)
MKELRGRTAVVIGGGSGVGRGIALGLAAEGMRVAVADLHAESARAVRDELAASGASAIALEADATDRASLQALAERTVADFDAVHLLVSTVGAIVDRPLDAATEDDWGWLIDFNVMAVVRGVDVFLPFLRSHGGESHIVCTSSMAGLLALPPAVVGGVYNGLYTTTKHALIGYGAMLRDELAPEGIGVSVLCPGLVQGNLGATSARNRPARYGGALAYDREGGMPAAAMPNEEVGPIVVRGIRANRLYIFTHPETVALVQARHDAMLEDFAFYATEPDLASPAASPSGDG